MFHACSMRAHAMLRARARHASFWRSAARREGFWKRACLLARAARTQRVRLPRARTCLFAAARHASGAAASGPRQPQSLPCHACRARQSVCSDFVFDSGGGGEQEKCALQRDRSNGYRKARQPPQKCVKFWGSSSFVYAV